MKYVKSVSLVEPNVLSWNESEVTAGWLSVNSTKSRFRDGYRWGVPGMSRR